MPDTVMDEMPAPLYRNRSAEIAKLAAALCKAQGAMEGAKKDAEAVITGTQKRTYADLASVWDAVRKPLADNGLAVIQFPRTAQNGVEIETTLAHSSGEFMSDVLWVPCGKFDAQGLGSAITYGRRYALMAVTGIAPIDDDGAAAVASHKPGVPGSAGGGTDFRPPGPRQSSAHGRQLAADEPQLVDQDRLKGTLPTKNGTAKPSNGKITPEERAAKIKAATDKRIKVLKDGKPWARVGLNDLWTEDAEWIEWMSDPANEVLGEYERFTNAFAEAELTIKETV